MLSQTSVDIPMIICSDDVSCERRISPSWTVTQFKSRLEPITGIPTSSQQIFVQSGVSSRPDAKIALETQDEDSTQLAGFGLRPYGEIHVSSLG